MEKKISEGQIMKYLIYSQMKHETGSTPNYTLLYNIELCNRSIHS